MPQLQIQRVWMSLNLYQTLVKPSILMFNQRTLTIGGSITVWLNSFLTGLDLTQQVKLLFIQHKQNSWTQKINRSVVQWYFPWMVRLSTWCKGAVPTYLPTYLRSVASNSFFEAQISIKKFELQTSNLRCPTQRIFSVEEFSRQNCFTKNFFDQIFKNLINANGCVVVVVKWSACSPSTQAIWVRTPLTPKFFL